MWQATLVSKGNNTQQHYRYECTALQWPPPPPPLPAWVNAVLAAVLHLHAETLCTVQW